MTHDLESLGKDLVYIKSPDTPSIFYAVVPELLPAGNQKLDQIRLEPYIRLKSLPLDLRRLVVSYAEAEALTNKVETLVPGFPKAVPTHYPSGAVELKWTMEDTSVFGIILHGFKIALQEDEVGNIAASRQGKISWRFHGPRVAPQSGEFKTMEELLAFVTRSFIP